VRLAHIWGSHQIAETIEIPDLEPNFAQHRRRHRKTSPLVLPQHSPQTVKMENDRGEIVDL